MQRPALGYIHRDDQITALAGLQLGEVLSTELFREQLGFPHGLPPRELVVSCQDSWTDLADTIAALPSPAELMLFVGAGLSKELFRDGAAIAFFALGRGETCEQAAEECLASFRELQTLLITNLDFARFSVIQSDELLDAAIRAMDADRITELREYFDSAQAARLAEALAARPA